MRETAAHLLQTLDQVIPLLQQITETESAHRLAPGKWSKKEIIGHLIDSAGNNQQKFVRALLSDGHLDFVGYAQDDWVRAQHYQQADWAMLVHGWASINRLLAHLIAHADPTKLPNTLSIEGSGPFRLDFIMADYVEHLKHHLKAVLPEAGLESRFQNVYNA